MKTKVLSIIYSILILSGSAFAQEEMFRVLANKGSNKVTTGNSTEWKVITPGRKIMSNEKITIAEGGYLGLAHKSGKTLELKKAGVYDVAKLNSELTAQNSGVAKKYVDFVAGEMAAKNEDMNKNSQNYMKVTGAVERDITTAKIKPVSPKNIQVINMPFMLKWSKVEKAQTYVVEIVNMFDEVVYKAETKENNIIVDLGKTKVSPDSYKWRVYVKEKPSVKSDEIVIDYVNNPDLLKEAQELKASLSEETALNKMVLASFFESKNLFANAMENYEAATKLEPSVDDYKASYGQFLDKSMNQTTK